MPLPFLTNSAARHLFLARHALAEPPAGPAQGAALGDLIGRIGFVQVDSINTVARAHHMILWSRRHSYRPEALKRLTETDRGLFEHWTHDASLLPIGLHPYWQHRFARDAARLHSNWKSWFRDGYEAQFDTILRRIEADGPVTSSDVGQGEARGKGGWWDWHPSKTALEWLWRTGQLAVAGRNGFQKVYDLTARVIPAAHRSLVHGSLVHGSLGHGGLAPDEAAMVDWACGSALDHLGFATAGEIRAYWNAVRPDEAKGWCAAALASGAAIEIEVEGAGGARKRMLARPDVLAEAPQMARALRILSPFDPALRDRDRAEFLFGFHYRIEVFVPEPKRVYGYYVFPVLEGDQIIGRLDAKAFRAESVLRVKAFWPEAAVKPGPQRLRRLDAALARLAEFAGCDRVEYLDGWLREPVAC